MTTTTIRDAEDLESFEENVGIDSVLIRDGKWTAWLGTVTEDGIYCLRFRTEDDIEGDEGTSTSGWVHGSVVSCSAEDLHLPLMITTEGE